METVSDLIFLGSKITSDGDCSHEIKRHLLLGRKAMINLDSMLKSRNITLLTKVCLVKTTVFPVVMYGCESWTIKKTESQRIDALNCGVGKDSKSPLNSKEFIPVHAKGNQSWISIGRTDTEAETPLFGHLMWRTDSLKKTLMLGRIEGGRRRGWQRMRWLDGITNSWSLLKLMFIESMMPSNHLIFCHPLLLPPSIFPSIRVFSNESVLCIRWPK